MTYNSNVPQSGQTLGNTRVSVNTNFNLIDARFSVNHVAFNDSGGGKHTYIQFPTNSFPAGPSGANEIVIGNVLNGSNRDLNFRPPNSSATIQLTRNDVPINAANGFTFLPGNLLLQWGIVNVPGGSGTVNFPLAFSSASYSVILTPRNDGSHSAFTYYLDGAPTPTQFSYRGSTTGSNSLYWMAIGS